MKTLGKNVLKTNSQQTTTKKLSDGKAKKYFESGQLIIATTGIYDDNRIRTTSRSEIRLMRKDDLLDNVATKQFSTYGKDSYSFQPWLLDLIECYSIKKQGKRPVKYYLTIETTKKLMPILTKLTEITKKGTFTYGDEKYGLRFIDLSPKEFYTAIKAGIKMEDIEKL